MNDLDFKCPSCGHIQTCPCPPCQGRNPTEKPWINNGDFILCGGCGLKKHSDWWADKEFDYYQTWKEEENV